MHFARLACAGLAGTALLLTAAAHAETAVERGERQLARLLGERTAGEPVECFEWTNRTRPVVIDRVALAYDNGDMIYVARPENAKLLDPRDTIRVTRVSTQRLCATDRFYVVSRNGGMTTGMAEVESFVPYTRQR